MPAININVIQTFLFAKRNAITSPSNVVKTRPVAMITTKTLKRSVE